MKPPARSLVAVVFTAALLGLAGTASAEDAQHAVESRPLTMRAIGAHTGAFVAILKGPVPDPGHKSLHVQAMVDVKTFKDCADCPQMVVIPAGRFQMGSPSGESGRADDEGPVHEVRIRRFALGKYEVTFAEYDACVAAGGCGQRPFDDGWGRGSRPLINVSWNDAKAYAGWLSRKAMSHPMLKSAR